MDQAYNRTLHAGRQLQLVVHASPSLGSANLFAMALVIVKSVCAMMVSFGIFPLAKALCQAAGVRLPKGTSTFIFWRGEGRGSA